MQRADSPTSLHSQDDSTPVTPKASHPPAGQKAAYRLFPSVEPTPPASPNSLQKAARSKIQATESGRRRSSSFDSSSRIQSALLRHGPSRQVSVASKRGRLVSMHCEVKPISTVQELPVDSPTVPTRFAFKFGASTTDLVEDAGHGRSSSAPSVAQSPLSQNVTSAVYMNKQAMTSTQTVHGLGLTLTEEAPNERPSSRTGHRHKPNLRLRVSKDKELPPPPPPKSPRHHSRETSAVHSRNTSTQSQLSIKEEPEPIVIAHTMSCSTVRPTFIHHTRSSSPASMRGPPTRAPPAVPPSLRRQGSDTHVSGLVHGRKDSRGRSKESLALQPSPSTLVTSSSEESSGPLPLPSSKFSTGSPVTDVSTEGEKTPKASTPTPVPQKQTQTPAVPNAAAATSNGNLRVEQASNDIRPPTPLKGSFNVEKRSDEVAKPPPTPLKDVHPQPLRSNKVTKQDTSSPSSHAREPPPQRKEERTRPEAVRRSNSSQATLRPVPIPIKEERPRQEAIHRSESRTLLLRPAPGSRSSTRMSTARPPSRAATPDITQRPERDGLRREVVHRPESPQLVLPPASPPRSKTPTPELPSRAVTPDIMQRPTPELPTHEYTSKLKNKGLSDKVIQDPLETLSDLSLQTEALHARYASLRSDRQKLSTSIVTSLKEQKAGPDHVNTLLDQHLQLAAVNSSMDICFAKLKSLDCRKEEAMAAYRAQGMTAKKKVATKVKKMSSVQSLSSHPSAGSRPGTPDLTMTIKGPRSASRLGTREDADIEEEAESPKKQPSPKKQAADDEARSSKRNTVIKSPPILTTPQITAEPEEDSTSPASVNNDDDATSASDTEAQLHPKKLRIKGAKAAKILGLMKEAAENRPGSLANITLPDEITRGKAAGGHGGGPAIEIHIPTSPFLKQVPPLRSPAPASPLPTPPPPAVMRKDTAESVASSTARSEVTAHSRAESSAESSSLEEHEAETPREERELRGELQVKDAVLDAEDAAVQVFVDDEEILDFYSGFDGVR